MTEQISVGHGIKMLVGFAAAAAVLLILIEAVNIAMSGANQASPLTLVLTGQGIGGAPPYTYSWYTGGSCSGTVLSRINTLTPTSIANPATYSVNIMDSNSNSVCVSYNV